MPTHTEACGTCPIEYPAFFDLQVNGFAGIDFNNPNVTPDNLHSAIGGLRETGVTRFLPALISSSFDQFAACAKALLGLNHPAIAGIHMEGPYLSPEDGPRGAHRRNCMAAASVEDFTRRQDAASGRIRLVTLAPEIEGALGLTEHLASIGVRVAIGHSNATPQQIRDAVSAGATLSTHLGNGCAMHLARHPNLLWEQLAADELFASFIADGQHLPPATLRCLIRAKTPLRSFLITDAIAAAGCSPGEYSLGDERVTLDAAGRVASPGNPWLSGSSLTMDRAVANTVKFAGLTLREVLPMASTQPAQFLGLQTWGTISADWDAARHELTGLRTHDG